jgi:hypothetical protein
MMAMRLIRVGVCLAATGGAAGFGVMQRSGAPKAPAAEPAEATGPEQVDQARLRAVLSWRPPADLAGAPDLRRWLLTSDNPRCIDQGFYAILKEDPRWAFQALLEGVFRGGAGGPGVSRRLQLACGAAAPRRCPLTDPNWRDIECRLREHPSAIEAFARHLATSSQALRGEVASRLRAGTVAPDAALAFAAVDRDGPAMEIRALVIAYAHPEAGAVARGLRAGDVLPLDRGRFGDLGTEDWRRFLRAAVSSALISADDLRGEHRRLVAELRREVPAAARLSEAQFLLRSGLAGADASAVSDVALLCSREPRATLIRRLSSVR